MLKAQVNRNRRIGCEYEMYLPKLGNSTNQAVQASLANILSANGLRATYRGYSQSPVPIGNDICVEYDSSIRGDFAYQGVEYAQIEFKTRILNGYDDWLAIVPKALSICSELGGRVNHTCGHHLHIDFPEAKENPRHIKSLYNLFQKFEKIIFGLVAPSRLTCGYAQPIPMDKDLLKGCNTFDSLRQALGSTPRKRGLNLTHVFKSEPRLEYRYFHGTLSVDKSKRWLLFCLQMLQHAIDRNCQSADQLPNTRLGIENLLVCCGFKPNSGIYRQVDPELRATGRFFLERWKHFNGRIALKPKADKLPAPPPSS